MMADEFDNVTPFRGRGMDAPAKRFFDSFTPAGEVEADLNRPYLIKGWFDKGMVSVLYGLSNVGKTFLALDIAHAISSGKSWGECRVRQAPVMYVESGDAVTTCVVEPSEEGREVKKAVVSGNAEIVLQAISMALEKDGVTKSGADFPVQRVVSSDHWKQACELHGLFEGLSPESVRSTFSRQKAHLNKVVLVRSFGGYWWRV